MTSTRRDRLEEAENRVAKALEARDRALDKLVDAHRVYYRALDVWGDLRDKS